MARPTALTVDVQQRVCDAVAGGNTRRDAAEYAGVGESTVRSWLAKGRREKEGPYVAFLAAVKKAEADAVVGSVARIRKAAAGGQVVKRVTKKQRDGTTVIEETFAPGQWTADAWWLERKYPADWGAAKIEIRELTKRVSELEQGRAVPRPAKPS